MSLAYLLMLYGNRMRTSTRYSPLMWMYAEWIVLVSVNGSSWDLRVRLWVH